MAGMEQFLPKEHQFITALTDVREPLVDILTDNIAEAQDIINPESEFIRPPMAVWSLSGGLARIFEPTEDSHLQVQRAMYRGLCFGFQVADEISTSPIRQFALNYGSGTSAEGVTKRSLAIEIVADVSEYLRARPELESLMFTFMPEVAEGYEYRSHAHLATGLALMLIERQQAEIYVQSAMGDLAVQLSEDSYYNSSKEEDEKEG